MTIFFTKTISSILSSLVDLKRYRHSQKAGNDDSSRRAILLMLLHKNYEWQKAYLPLRASATPT